MGGEGETPNTKRKVPINTPENKEDSGYSRFHNDFESFEGLELPVRCEDILGSRCCNHQLVSSQHEQLFFPLFQSSVDSSVYQYQGVQEGWTALS